MTHPDFQLPVQDCETDHGIDNYEDLPEEFGGDTLKPAKVTELTSDQLTQLRMALQYYTAFANEAMGDLLNVFEYGCGVTVRNCEAQSQYEIDNI